MPAETGSIYIGTFIHCTSLTDLSFLENYAVGVDEHGTIKFVESAGDNKLEDHIKSCGWQSWKTFKAPKGGVGFWFPGFIDAHIHASQYPNSGIFGKTTLMSWLQKYTFPLESSLSSLPKARAVYSRCISRTLAHGTTTAAYYATVDVLATNLLADLAYSAGQRAFIGRCAMDSHLQPDYYRDASASSGIADSEASIQHINAIDPTHSLITPILTPRFAPSCTFPLLSGLASLATTHNLPIQTHISENSNEIALVRGLFPDHDSYAAVYNAAGLLTPKTVLAHAIHLSPAEQTLVKATGAHIAHCPASNTFLGSGICPVRELLDMGINVGLGTDVSGGYSPSILVAAREAGGVSRMRTAPRFRDGEGKEEGERDRMKLSVEETLWMGTRGGARCLGLEGKVGGFEVGMEWDAQFVDLGARVGDGSGGGGEEGVGGKGNVEVWEWMGWEDVIAKWVFHGDDRNVKAVWVKGRLVSGSMD